ncbi:MAG: SH3 domain-containing protein [Treponema sp.]
MKKSVNKIIPVFLSAGLLLCAAGCSKKIGYGVVNWSSPEHNLTANDVVPILVRSNISKVYIVELNDEKVEIPLWQLTFCSSKREASAYIKKTAEYRSVYAAVKLDGLPLRSKPDNTGKQIYRLRENQIVKVLWKGEGAPVIARDKPLEGDWLSVMTNDGTQGWCFSYNLHLYDENASAVPQQDNGIVVDEILNTLLQARWYPDYYRDMIRKKQIDPERMTEAFGFFADEGAGIVRINLKEEQVSFPYTGISKNRMGAYQFEGSPLLLQIRNEDTIAVHYTDAKGRAQIRYFITLKENPEELAGEERARRSAALQALTDTGPVFNSGNYGILRFLEGGRFLWNGYQVLSPLVIPKGAGASGYAAIRFFIGSKLKTEYQGVLSFKFDGSETWIDFFYVLSSQGLKLEYVKPDNIKDGVASVRNLSPVILFFGAEGTEE